MNWPLIKNRVIELAVQELDLWSANDLKEYDADATAILEKYWRSVKSEAAAKKIVEELQADPQHELHPWSAAFISWVMKTAGATGFKKSFAHRVYVADAKYNRENNITINPFWAYRVHEVKPEPGDLVCQRRCTAGQYHDPAMRPKKCATYDIIDDTGSNGKQIEWRTHCDIVTKVRSKSIDVIGGNVSQRVFKKKLPLDAEGYVKKKITGENQYIAIVKFRNAPTEI